MRNTKICTNKTSKRRIQMIKDNKNLKTEAQIELIFEELTKKHSISNCNLNFNYNSRNTRRMGYCKPYTRGKTKKYDIVICMNNPIVEKWEKDSEFKRLMLHELAHALTEQKYGYQKKCHNSVWLAVYNSMRRKENLKDIKYPRYK